jgi:predicted secreted protein
MPTIVLGQADNGKSIESVRGQTLSISLPGNETPGYEWAINVGSAWLQFKRWQPWEGDSSVVEHYSLTVEVRG